ncbi:cupin-like domain-containing protein [uncultured Enterovirga sp.]|uniref:cupin-like domain-containing protein n=1 Tax=uncultured Enterovirga sp. TaxID=2026352 RepID=UPI0035CA5759
MTALIELDQEARKAFPERPFATRHNLADHPLFSLEKLVELAGQMPPDGIEYNSGKVGIDQKPEETPLVDMAAIEVVRRIKEANAWLVLKRVERMPAYAALLREVLDGVARDMGHRDAADAGFTHLEGFVFVSSPNATTPFHSDPEDNFFVQIHGDKFFHVIDNQDRSVVPDLAFEVTPSMHRNLPYRPDFEDRATVFTMKAGDGCFVPYLWPHWVKTGDSYSISMAVTWKSPAVRRSNKVLFVNALLRKWGMPQKPPGMSPALDWAKAAAYTAARAPLEPLRRSDRLRAMLRGLLFGRNANYYLQARKG